MIKDFNTIEVGQWVWTEDDSWQTSSNRRIREVTRLTPTLIICDEEDEFDRFYRRNGYNRSQYCGYNHIDALATPEEIIAVGIPRKQSRAAEKVRQARCEEIKPILPSGMSVWLRYEDQKWETRIELKGLTENQVREIAGSIAAICPKEVA